MSLARKAFRLYLTQFFDVLLFRRLCFNFSFSLCSPSASRNVSDWWLAYWISHSRTNTTVNHVNQTTAYHGNHMLPSVQTAYQLGLHVHIVKNTVTFYLVVYGGLAVANSVRLFAALKTSLYLPFNYLFLGMLFYFLVSSRVFQRTV